MSVSAAEVLERVEKEGVPSLWQRRLQHAASVVLGVIHEAKEANDPSWLPLANDVAEAGEKEDWARVFELILEGYRRVMFERTRGDVELPQTQAEWDALPDPLEELNRRKSAS